MLIVKLDGYEYSRDGRACKEISHLFQIPELNLYEKIEDCDRELSFAS